MIYDMSVMKQRLVLLSDTHSYSQRFYHASTAIVTHLCFSGEYSLVEGRPVNHA
jgi:hypothetical protein